MLHKLQKNNRLHCSKNNRYPKKHHQQYKKKQQQKFSKRSFSNIPLQHIKHDLAYGNPQHLYNIEPENPVTTQHIARKSVGPIHSACVSIKGLRDTQEDSHMIVTPYDKVTPIEEIIEEANELGDFQLPSFLNKNSKPNPNGIFAWGIFDGHKTSDVSNYLATNVPKYLQYLPNLHNENIQQDIIELCEYLDDCIIKHIDGGSTAIVVLGQYYNTITNEVISYHNIPHDYSIITSPHIKMNLLGINIGDSQSFLFPIKRIIENDQNFSKFELTIPQHPDNQNEKERIKASGSFIKDSYISVPYENYKNNKNGEIYETGVARAFGDKDFKSNPNIHKSKQAVTYIPEFVHSSMYPGDILLLSCDGVDISPIKLPIELCERRINSLLQSTEHAAIQNIYRIALLLVDREHDALENFLHTLTAMPANITKHLDRQIDETHNDGGLTAEFELAMEQFGLVHDQLTQAAQLSHFCDNLVEETQNNMNELVNRIVAAVDEINDSPVDIEDIQQRLTGAKSAPPLVLPVIDDIQESKELPREKAEQQFAR